MPCYLGGYYLPFPATRHIMKNLQIDDKGVENWRIGFPINDWLAKHGKKDILAGVLQHPSTGRQDAEPDGLLLVTQFRLLEGAQDNVSFKEGDKERRVKAWLINDGGAKESDLEWMSVRDEYEITSMGFVPTENEFSALHTVTEMTPDQRQRWEKAGYPPAAKFLEAEGVQSQEA